MEKRIYSILHPVTNAPVYVGATSTPLWHRMGQHRTSTRKAPIAAWCREMKLRGYHVNAVELAPKHPDWSDSEIFWIEYLTFIGAELLNETRGGSSNRMSDRLKKRFNSIVTNESFATPAGDRARKRWADPEYKERVSKRISESRAGEVGKRHSEFMKQLWQKRKA